ncbi:MAG TPA: PilZ domain-containing protein [Candidatus Methylomirabilis sp.]
MGAAVGGADRRQQSRVSQPGSLLAVMTSGDMVRVVNLSPAGAMIQHAEPLFPDETLKLFLRIGGMELEVPVRLVWSDACGEQLDPDEPRRAAFRSGLLFSGLPRYAELKLRHYLTSLGRGRG